MSRLAALLGVGTGVVSSHLYSLSRGTASNSHVDQWLRDVVDGDTGNSGRINYITRMRCDEGVRRRQVKKGGGAEDEGENGTENLPVDKLPKQVEGKTKLEKQLAEIAKVSTPAKAVIIGGGYSGGKLAYYLDSIFDVIFIDTKNYQEFTHLIVPLLTKKWTEQSDKELATVQHLHRYYLKHSNVVTSRVDDVNVNKRTVMLSNGKEIKYDLLALTMGEQKPFPFSSQTRTLPERQAELRSFNKFLIEDCKKVAVVGGGPMGTSVALSLAAQNPDKEVVLYHGHELLLPNMPHNTRQHVLNRAVDLPNLDLRLNTRVTRVRSEKKAQPAKTSSGGAEQQSRQLNSQLAVEGVEMLREPYRAQSVFSRLLLGTRQEQLTWKGKTDAEIAGIIASEESREVNDGGFDYVFNCSGSVPRPFQDRGTLPSLAPHLSNDGHFRVTRYFQLFGHPNIFSLGRCADLPWVRSYGTSDALTRCTFRMLNIVASKGRDTQLQESDGIVARRLATPRIMLTIGNDEAVGSMQWSGGLTGTPALREFTQDRHHLSREFVKPLFFKHHDWRKVRIHWNRWLEKEVTDVSDYEVYEKFFSRSGYTEKRTV